MYYSYFIKKRVIVSLLCCCAFFTEVLGASTTNKSVGKAIVQENVVKVEKKVKQKGSNKVKEGKAAKTSKNKNTKQKKAGKVVNKDAIKKKKGKQKKTNKTKEGKADKKVAKKTIGKVVKKGASKKEAGEKKVGDKDKGQEGEKVAIKVNKEELWLKQRLGDYSRHQPWQIQQTFRLLSETDFFHAFNRQLGGVDESLRKSRPLFNEQAIKNLRLLEGTLSNSRHSLANRLMEDTDMTLMMARFALVSSLGGLNNDKKRIKYNRRMVEGFWRFSKEAFSLKKHIEACEGSFDNVMRFSQRNLFSHPTNQAVGDLIKFDTNPVFWWLITLGVVDAEALEQSNPSVKMHMATKNHLAIFETMTEAQLHINFVTKVYNSGRWLLHLLTWGWSQKLGEDDRTSFSLPKHQHERFCYSLVNVLFKRVKAFWGLLHGRGRLKHLVTGGGRENSMFYDGLSRTRFNDSRLQWFSYATFIFDWSYHGPLHFFRSIYRLSQLGFDIYARFKRWQHVTIALQALLKDMASVYKAIVKVEKLIRSNPELAKTLDGPSLRAIQRLARHKELRLLIRDTVKVSKAPAPTILNLLLLSSDAIKTYTTYKRWDSLDEDMESILLEALVGVSCLHMYQALGTHVFMTERNMKQGNLCFAEMKEQERPMLVLEAGYTPMIKSSQVVRNDYSLGDVSGRGGGKSTYICTGMNGSGKSECMGSTPYHSLCLIQFAELAFAKGAKATYTDKIFFQGAETGDVAKGKSKYMQECGVIKDMVEYISSPTHAKKSMLVFLDEFGNGTIRHEAHALLFAFLKFLGKHRNVMTLAATHDIELFNIARREKYDGFEHYTTAYDEKSKRFPYKLKKGIIDKPASVYVTRDILKNPKSSPSCSKLFDESIRLLKRERAYPFKHLLPPGGEGQGDTNWSGILLGFLFMLAGGGVVYRRRRRDVGGDGKESTRQG